MSVIIIPRKIGPVAIDCFLYEQHRVNLAITDNAVEDGSSVSDHAYTRPNLLTLDIADEDGAATFVELVEAQALREPFTIVTGLAVYNNMLIENINASRSKETSFILSATVDLREVKIVGTQTTVGGGTIAQEETIGLSLDEIVNDQISSVVELGDTGALAVEINESILAGLYQ